MRFARMVLAPFSRALGPLLLWTRKRAEEGIILLYHRVSPDPDPAYPPLRPEEFERHCRFLRRHFDVLPLSELLGRLARGASPRGCCAITFDDGYRDFLEYSHPVLRAWKLPHAHFLIADCVDEGRPTWNLRLRHLVRDSRAMIGARRKLAVLPREERYAWLEREERAKPRDPEPEMLRASDLGALSESGLLEWGSHTRSHAMLPFVSDGELERELAESKRRLEQLTSGPIRWIAYPNGEHDERVERAAVACGYEGGLAVGQTPLRAGAPGFAVPRMDVSNIPAALLGFEIGGVTARLRRLVRPAGASR